MGFWNLIFGFYGGGEYVAPAVVTTRVSLVGSSQQRLALVGQSAERASLEGTSQRRLSQESSSR